MAVTTTPRLGINRWSAGTDAWPGRSGWDSQQQKFDDLTAIDLQGTIALRPVAGVRGRFYFTTDTRKLYRDDGVQWNEIGPNGGVVPSTLAFAGAAVEGTSARSARADHKHAMPAHDDAAHTGVQLSAFAPPTAPVNMGGQKLTGLGAPTVADDAATRQFAVDQAAGLITAPETPTPILFGGTGAIGVSSKAARADHKHALDDAPWVSWTPTWATSIDPPSIGNGILAGQYKKIGRTVWFTFKLQFGSTTVAGVGNSYAFGLPVARNENTSLDVIFPAVIIDSSAGTPGYRTASGICFAPISFGIVTHEGTAGRFIGSGSPWVWATGDIIRVSGCYEAAA
jgi:hypothetical protein